jgi:alpha-tubulin suppressor-like RCC1 family protein
MSTNYKFVNSALTGTSSSVALDDYFIRRSPFIIDGLWSWGNSTTGQLGRTGAGNSPGQIGSLTNWKECNGWVNHSGAIRRDGTLWVWGSNSQGDLGIGSTTNATSPIQISGGGTNWKQVAGGIYHTVALKTDGTMWVSGSGTEIVGAYATSPVSTFVQIGTSTDWKQIANGYYGVSAIKTDGTLWTWGNNFHGETTGSTSAARSTPTQITGGGTWSSVAHSASFTSAAIKTDGTLWLWGINSSGILGNNDSSIAKVSSPIQIYGGGTDWKSISAGGQHAAAIKADGTLWLWGSNSYGQLGNNDSAITAVSSPIQIYGGGTNWKQIACGFHHTVALKTDGTLWIWGSNQFSQLGLYVLGTGVTAVSSPVQIYVGGNNWKTVGVGQYHTIGIREDI